MSISSAPPPAAPAPPAIRAASDVAVPVTVAVSRPPLRSGRARTAGTLPRGALRHIGAAATGQVARDLGVIAILAGAVLVFFWPSLTKGQVAYENDTRIFYYPLFARLGEALKSGTLPLWSPQLFTGYPIFADGEAGSLYPLHLLALLALPVETAFIVTRPIRFFQAALFTFLFCRSLGLGRFGSVVGALAFAFSGFAIAQLHHTNISTAAVWLPLALTFVELALRGTGRVRYVFAILAGVAFGLQGLIIHVQVVLMSALTFGTYCLFRVLAGPVGAGDGPYTRLCTWTRRHPLWGLGPLAWIVGRLALGASLVAIAGGLGAALSAVQLLPLYELSTFSFRGGGVDYAFASQYSLPPVQLISLLFPDFFVTNGQYWGLWSRWEVFAYAGIAPVLLAALGLLVARHRLSLFFALVAAVSLAMALGEYSPFGIHRVLAGLPGFAVLRAPGRFVFLFTFGVAMLAAFGGDALRRHFDGGSLAAGAALRRRAAARSAALSAAILLLQLGVMLAPLFLALASALAQGQKDQTIDWLQQTFVRMRGFDTRLSVEQLYQNLLASLDVTQEATLRPLALLFASAGLLVLWDRLRRFGRLWQTLLVVTIAADLIGFGQHFHPTMAYADLAAPSGVAGYLAQNPGLYRVFTQKGTRDEPNRLLGSPAMEANGYSSLQPTRHDQYAALAEYAQNRLLDMMNVRYYAVKNEAESKPSFNLTSFDPRHPILSSTGRNPAGSNSFRLDNVSADSLRVVSTLRWSTGVAQGAEVAKITALDADGKSYGFRLLAGQHTSEWTWERPDLKGKVAHQLAPVAFTWQQRDGKAPPFPAHYYYAEFPLGKTLRLKQLDVVFTHATAQVDVYGIAAFDDTSKDLEQLDRSKLTTLQRVYADRDMVLYENRTYLPRAFLVPSAVVERPGDEILTQMAQGDFSPERFVILEDQFDVATLPPPGPADSATPVSFNQSLGTEITSGPGTVSFQRFDDDDLRLEVSAKQPAMLLLADEMYPGWSATIDGHPARIYRADYLFRTVYVPAGRHSVEFVYRPRSFRLGMLITLVATAGTLGALLWLAFGLPRRRHPVTMDSPGSTPPDAAVVPAERGILTQKGRVSDGRQESKEHAEAESTEAGGQGREEEVARPSNALAEAALGRSV